MKKLLLSFFTVLLSAVIQLNGQQPAFTREYKVINTGAGLGSNLFREAYYSTVIPPVSVSFEFGIKDHVLERGVIGTGFYVGAGRYKYEFSRKGWKTTNYIIGARGNLHYPLIRYFDTYTGFMLGYEILGIEYFGGYNETDYTGTSNGIAWAWYIGGRYYFSENMAALLELGYGDAYVTVGIAFKL
jgi:hypothetical protein